MPAQFAALAEHRVDGVIVGGDPFFTGQRERLVALAARHALPAFYNLWQFVVAGGLMSYGSSITTSIGKQASIVAEFSRGYPSDLAVMLPTKFKLTINLKTVKSLGLDVPQTVLARADE